MKAAFVQLICVCLLSQMTTIAQTKTYENLRQVDLEEVQLWSSKLTEFDGVRIGLLCRDANGYFREMLADLDIQVNLLFLDREDWSKYAIQGLIYGMPHFKASDNAIILASEDNDFWKMQLPERSKLTGNMKKSFEDAYRYGDDFSASGFFHLLGIHELAHIWRSKGGLALQRLWLEEVFCNLALHTYIAEEQRERLPALEVLPAFHVSNSSSQMKYTTLEIFEKEYYKIGMEAPVNYGWYQFRFHQAAKKLYDAGGAEVLQNLWNFLGKHQEKLSDEELKEKLATEVHPYFRTLIEEW